MQTKPLKAPCSFFMICLLIGFSAFGQTGGKQPLLEVMQQLEQTYNIRFSYVPKQVEGVVVSIPQESNDLQTVLKQLNRQTQLKFTLLKNRYVTVVAALKASYCGRIIAWDSGKALAGASIHVSDTSLSTISNSSGFFHFSSAVSPKTQITITYVGYFPVNISVGELSASCPVILMHPKATELSEVVIKAFLVKGISKQANGSVRLNIADFGLLPGQVENDVLQIAQALPGVESVDETISNINIRGGANFETLLLWNDMKIYQSGHFFGLISAFNPNLTEQVTLYKNGTPPRYGESTSGVIALKSKDEVAKEFSGGLGVNLTNANAFVSIPLSKNASLQLSGRHSLSFLKTPVYSTYSKRMFQHTKITNVQNPNQETQIGTQVDFSFYDIGANLLWDFSEKDKLRINFMTIDNHLEFTESIEDYGSETSELGQRSMVGGLSWEHTWNSKIKTTAMTYATHYRLNALNKDLFTTQTQYQENEILETGLKLDSRFIFSEKTTLQAGYQFTETGIANTQDINLPRFRDYKKEVIRTNSLFSNLVYTPNQNQTRLNIGARISFFNKFDKPSIEPRLSLHQKLGSGFSVDILGEMMSQTTSQRIDFESDFLGIEKKRWILSDNHRVPIIKNKQVSLGVNYDKHNWLIGLKGFYKEVSGITAESQAFQNQFQYVNAIGSYAVDGLEFIINKRARNFSVWFSYFYMQNDYTFENLTPTSFPNNIDIRHTATLAGTYTVKNFKFAAGLNWHTGIPYTIPDPNQKIILVNGQETINFSTPNQKRLPDYYRFDISAEYLWELSPSVNAKINIALLNLLDTKNTLNIHYTLTSDKKGNSRINRVEKISLGFTPKLSLKLLF